MLLINDSADIIGKSISDLRDLSRSMSSEIILNYGLQKALEIETVQIAKSGIYKINLSVTGDRVCMNTETELVLFRIVQEVLNNIVKHSEASVIEIKLHFTASLLTVEVNDDGKGFNTAETLTGNGLHNIKKRADILNGNLTIKSNINQGTIIKIEIPLFEYNHET
jgi:signal transduction histidine kinase